MTFLFVILSGCATSGVECGLTDPELCVLGFCSDFGGRKDGVRKEATEDES